MGEIKGSKASTRSSVMTFAGQEAASATPSMEHFSPRASRHHIVEVINSRYFEMDDGDTLTIGITVSVL